MTNDEILNLVKKEFSDSFAENFIELVTVACRAAITIKNEDIKARIDGMVAAMDNDGYTKDARDAFRFFAKMLKDRL